MTVSRGTLAAVATLAAGFVIGVTGFLAFVREVASSNNTLMLQLAARQSSGSLGGTEMSTAAPVAFTMLAPLAFVVGTPTGWLAAYLVVTGLVRCLAASVRDPRGDPLLALLRRLFARWRARREDARSRAVYEAAAGPEVADRLARPERFDIAGADLVLVASRPKPDWTPGTVLNCGDRRLSVGAAVERMLPVGLRTLYPLADVPSATAMRREVPYDLPKGVE